MNNGNMNYYIFLFYKHIYSVFIYSILRITPSLILSQLCSIRNHITNIFYLSLFQWIELYFSYNVILFRNTADSIVLV